MNDNFLSEDSEKEVYASVAVIINNGKFLGVTRKNQPDNWGLPGGKKNKNESPEECCLRELEEETGFKGKIISFLLSRTDITVNKQVNAYLVEIVSGNMIPEDSIKVDWISEKELLSGVFKNYNKQTFEKLKQLKII